MHRKKVPGLTAKFHTLIKSKQEQKVSLEELLYITEIQN